MNLWRGHIYLGVSIASGLIAMALVLVYFYNLRLNSGSLWLFLVFVAAALLAVVCLTTAALSYAQWVPKWERDEKRTGHILGEKEKE
jgi:uncharacterized membrane protein